MIQDDLRKVQEKRASLEVDTTNLREKADEDSNNLQCALDDARSQLMKNVREASSRNAAEVSKLEAELQYERQNAAMAVLDEQHCSERIADLQRLRAESKERTGAAAENRRQQQLAEAARCSMLSNELSSVRAEMSAAEGRLAASSRRVAEADVRAAKAESEGSRRASKVRGMIEEVWREIRSQAAMADVDRSSSHHLLLPGMQQ